MWCYLGSGAAWEEIRSVGTLPSEVIMTKTPVQPLWDLYTLIHALNASSVWTSWSISLTRPLSRVPQEPWVAAQHAILPLVLYFLTLLGSGFPHQIPWSWLGQFVYLYKVWLCRPCRAHSCIWISHYLWMGLLFWLKCSIIFWIENTLNN